MVKKNFKRLVPVSTVRRGSSYTLLVEEAKRETVVQQLEKECCT